MSLKFDLKKKSFYGLETVFCINMRFAFSVFSLEFLCSYFMGDNKPVDWLITQYKSYKS